MAVVLAKQFKLAQDGRSLKDSVVGRDVDILTTQLDRMNGDGFNRRHTEGAAGANVEPRSVARTFNFAPGQFPFRERTTVVRTDIVDGVENVIEVEYGDRSPIDLHQFLAPQGQIGTSRDLDKL
jgi:hypothetical protein